jgi:hypothetical protein
MVNDHKTFQKKQRDLKKRYLGGARDNHTSRQSDPKYNSGNNTDMSPGAAGRE